MQSMTRFERLSRNIQQQRARLVTFSAKTFVLDARGVLYMPSQKLLVFSDLHFEKGSYLAQFANPLPRWDTASTIANMQVCLNDYEVSCVLCLGDSLHDQAAHNRMREEDLKAVQAMVQSVAEWVWVTGNHDPVVPSSMLGESAHAYCVDDIQFVHEPLDSARAEYGYQVIGHYHPKARRKIAGRYFSGKCFLQTPSLLMMPAFGAYTGGLDITEQAITSLFPPSPDNKVHLMYQQHLYSFAN